MTILENIRGPRDLKALSKAELRELSEEIREFLVAKVLRRVAGCVCRSSSGAGHGFEALADGVQRVES